MSSRLSSSVRFILLTSNQFGIKSFNFVFLLFTQMFSMLCCYLTPLLRLIVLVSCKVWFFSLVVIFCSMWFPVSMRYISLSPPAAILYFSSALGWLSASYCLSYSKFHIIYTGIPCQLKVFCRWGRNSYWNYIFWGY